MKVPFFRRKRSATPLISSGSVQRILVQNASVFCLLVVLFLGMVYRSLYAISKEAYLSSTYNSMLSLLEQTDRTLQSSLQELEARGDAVLQSSSVSDLMVADVAEDFSLLSGASEQLSNLQNSAELIESAWLYLAGSDCVLTPSRSLLPRADFPEALQPLLDSTGLSRQDKSYYLVLQYPKTAPLATLVLQLKGSALYRLVNNSYQRIYVYDQSLEPLFSPFCHYPEESALGVSRVIQSSESSALFLRTDPTDAYLVFYRSSQNGLNYMLCSEPLSFLQANRTSLQFWLPCALLMVLGALFYSRFSFYNVYRPVQRMLDAITSAGDIPAAAAAAPAAQAPIPPALSAMAPGMARQLIHRILFEGLSDRDTIQASLSAVQNALPWDTPFVLLCFQPCCLDDLPPAQTHQTLYLLHLRSLAESYWRDRFPFSADENPEGQLVFTVFCGEHTPAELRAAAERFSHTMESQARDYPYVPVIGLSEPAQGLDALRDAYLSASQSFRRQLYYRNAAPKSDSQPWQEQTQALLAAALHQEPDALHVMLEELCGRIQRGEPQASGLQRIHSTLVETVLDCGIDLAQLPALQRDFAKDPELLLDIPENHSYLTGLLSQAAECLLGYSQTSRNRYLSSAKEYIAQNYADPSLSLDVVSQHVGISSPYLSSTFSELQGQRFVEYLNQYRVEKAQNLLQVTSLTVTEIGFRTGFYSANSFIRVFKKLVGVPPGAYRNQFRESSRS